MELDCESEETKETSEDSRWRNQEIENEILDGYLACLEKELEKFVLRAKLWDVGDTDIVMLGFENFVRTNNIHLYEAIKSIDKIWIHNIFVDKYILKFCPRQYKRIPEYGR